MLGGANSNVTKEYDLNSFNAIISLRRRRFEPCPRRLFVLWSRLVSFFLAVRVTRGVEIVLERPDEQPPKHFAR